MTTRVVLDVWTETVTTAVGTVPVFLDGPRTPVIVWNVDADCLLFVGCLTSQQHASVSRGQICTDNCSCCHTEIDQTFYLTQSQYTDTGPTSSGADPIMPGVWQGSHWSANFKVTCNHLANEAVCSRRCCSYFCCEWCLLTLTLKYCSRQVSFLFFLLFCLSAFTSV